MEIKCKKRPLIIAQHSRSIVLHSSVELRRTTVPHLSFQCKLQRNNAMDLSYYTCCICTFARLCWLLFNSIAGWFEFLVYNFETNMLVCIQIFAYDGISVLPFRASHQRHSLCVMRLMKLGMRWNITLAPIPMCVTFCDNPKPQTFNRLRRIIYLRLSGGGAVISTYASRHYT